MSNNALLSIIVAASSSIGKTFLIGLTGFVATRYPKKSPLLPSSPQFMSALSRLTFTMLILPLIYEGIASSVKLTSLESLYPVIIASFGIIGISFLVTLILGYMPCFRLSESRRRQCFTPLCVASTFPNIVALPIIIFPTLCEYEVTHDLVTSHGNVDDGTSTLDMEMGMDNENSSISTSQIIETCITQANSVIFAYFFGFSIVIWTIGQYTLINCGSQSQSGEQLDGSDVVPIERTSTRVQILSYLKKVSIIAKSFVVGVLKLPSFQSLVVAFITVCIPPLQRALFNPGGSMRVIGSALEALAAAGATFATIVVAAALSPRRVEHENDENIDEMVSMVEATRHVDYEQRSFNDSESHEDMSEIESLPDSTKVQHSEKEEDHHVGMKSTRCWPSCSIRDSFRNLSSDDLKIYIWQITSRLLVTPAVVYLILIKLDCSGMLNDVPPIASIVLLINSALPGALVIVVILKAEGLEDAATTVSKTYLPTYLISVLTVAMWASIGLMTWRPASTICQRF